MGEEKVGIQELAQKVDELLNVLKAVSVELSEVSKSLKAISGSATAAAVSVAPLRKEA